MRDSIVDSSQAANLTVTNSYCDASVGEQFHQKRDHMSVRHHVQKASDGDHARNQTVLSAAVRSTIAAPTFWLCSKPASISSVRP